MGYTEREVEFRQGRTVPWEASESLPLSVQLGAIQPASPGSEQHVSLPVDHRCDLTAGDLTTPLAGIDLSERGPPLCLLIEKSSPGQSPVLAPAASLPAHLDAGM